MPHPSPAGRRLGSAWEPRTRRTRSTATISRDDVVRAAIAVLDADGLAAVSMRRVATVAGVGVTTLYWHVADKEELLDLVCDSVLGEALLAFPSRGAWRTRLQHALGGLRRSLLSHGDLALHFAARPNVGPNALALRETIGAALLQAGLTPTEARSVDRVLLGYTTGACCTELAADAAADEQGLAADQVEAGIGAFLAELPADLYPSLVRLGRESKFTQRERDFVLGLDCLLAGVEQRLARKRPAGQPSSSRRSSASSSSRR